MTDKDEGLDRLCEVYGILDRTEKVKLIRLAEGLLNSQKILENEKVRIKEKQNEKV